MYEPIRGGTRGGQAEFKWTDVSADKDRENYLGHSINAPTGRWQKNKDVHWYNRDLKDSEFERLEEIRKIKEAEADALAVALGFTPEPKQIKSELSGEASEDKTEDPKLVIEKEERRRRKEAKRAKKEAKRERKEVKRGLKRGDRDNSRSRSPHTRSRRPRSRSRTPRLNVDYDSDERERERRRDRRRWELNAQRNIPQSGAAESSRWPRGHSD